ncbi:hypothetical protein D9758_016121 [Tetrapyrgos nigripes]|uniref:Uncharacterized protein n=1 Tax=Tetrapyrgos nigripes TaxID=182062 RepID=A0A8H5FCT5_9AGAR|nr:hypothetical protein D9758_016121 [Tetrapyrgos nigripes]
MQAYEIPSERVYLPNPSLRSPRLNESFTLLRESSAVVTARSKRIEKEMVDAGLIPPPQPALPTLPPKTENPRDSTVSLNSRSGKNAAVDEEEEAIGLHVGAKFAEKYIATSEAGTRQKSSQLPPYPRMTPKLTATLDVIKFVCKDLWAACWDKQVDNLRTNHRLTKSIQGIYVLQDNAFKTITRLSSWEGRADATRKAKLYVAMPAGLIKGALQWLDCWSHSREPEKYGIHTGL